MRTGCDGHASFIFGIAVGSLFYLTYSMPSPIMRELQGSEYSMLLHLTNMVPGLPPLS